jgi:hypothetical protein
MSLQIPSKSRRTSCFSTITWFELCQQKTIKHILSETIIKNRLAQNFFFANSMNNMNPPRKKLAEKQGKS